MTCVLDTHVWIWWHTDPSRLSPRAASMLDVDSSNDLAVPAICVWELAKLVSKGRLGLSEPVTRWVERALQHPLLRVAPLAPDVAIESASLPGEFHADPADQMIVATARLLDADLITADQRIRAYPHVRSVW